MTNRELKEIWIKYAQPRIAELDAKTVKDLTTGNMVEMPVLFRGPLTSDSDSPIVEVIFDTDAPDAFICYEGDKCIQHTRQCSVEMYAAEMIFDKIDADEYDEILNFWSDFNMNTLVEDAINSKELADNEDLLDDRLKEAFLAADTYCEEHNIPSHKLTDLYEAATKRIPPQDKREMNALIDNANDYEDLNALMSAYLYKKLNESLTESEKVYHVMQDYEGYTTEQFSGTWEECQDWIAEAEAEQEAEYGDEFPEFYISESLDEEMYHNAEIDIMYDNQADRDKVFDILTEKGLGGIKVEKCEEAYSTTDIMTYHDFCKSLILTAPDINSKDGIIDLIDKVENLTGISINDYQLGSLDYWTEGDE